MGCGTAVRKLRTVSSSLLDPTQVPTRPRVADLRMPVLVLLAEYSRAHHAGKVADRACRMLQQGKVVVLPGATHHSLTLHRAAATE
ncbi:hypothetical protein SAM40697_6147 [Streptomyces ambofaciens]|uniref:Uncharacterized protein n=1 Tax=Streptomyces ambofaciens TaxID=1889 RepID=A0ABM6B7X5_STRAM|nr:hypothetical protein SAM40697_6147 [Streptomyces ambofaciens]